MIRSLRVLLAIAVACITTVGFAQNYIGTYKGKMTVDKSALSAKLSPEQKKMFEDAMKELDKMKLTLTINKNKTFKLVSVGGPQTSKTNSSSGTWAPSGANLKLTFNLVNDKPMTNKQEQMLSVGAGGKTLTFIPPAGQTGKSKVVFTRA